jgi:osomolarity two-component system phosphorelay intermediate protein YPD1
MQHYGKKADKDGITELTEEVALEKLTNTLKEVKTDYKEAEVALRKFYDEGETNE